MENFEPKADVLEDFTEVVDSIKEFITTCNENNMPVIAEKWQGVLDAFNKFSPDEIIYMEQYMH